MRYQHILSAVYGQPWMISEPGMVAVHKVLEPHLRGAPIPFEYFDPDADGDDDSDEHDEPDSNQIGCLSYLKPDGSAVLEVHGTLLQHAGMVEKMCGAVSYDDIAKDLAALSADARVSKIVLDFDTPGGAAIGCGECAAMVAEIAAGVKPIVAHTGGQMCSAGYYLATPCNEITCTPSAIVGSIGTLLAILDSSGQFEQEGLKMHLFATGKYKGAGTDGVPISKEQAEQFQQMVDDLGDQFKSFVRSWRGVKDEFMQGQALIGQRALSAGLVDRVLA